MSATLQTGRCLCGAVTIEVSGPPKWTAWCHCESCRRHSGAPASAFAGFEQARVAISGETFTRFASSPGVRRGFCARCGSTLTYEGDRWPGEVHLHVGVFDRPDAFPPKGHANEAERVAWLSETPP